jgi:dihydroorotate dehydrogenase (fumarate)
MRRKGYSTLDQVRGTLAVPEDQEARERADYVGAVREANNHPYGTW